MMVGLTAGHHAYDTGATGGGLLEHIITLQTLGHAISYLAERKIYVVSPCGKLSRKITELNRYRRDLSCAVEIHYNSVASPNASGVEVIYHPGSTRGRTLATILGERVSSVDKLRLRKVMDTNELNRRLGFTREVAAPAVIIEPLWISNPQERELARDPQVIKEISIAIADSIIEFTNLWGRI
jgi:N-acetylmuramoyl-L-alanine amidase